MKLFQSRKSRIALAAELIMPWLTLICGIPAFYYWQKSREEWRIEYNSEEYHRASDMLDFFFNGAMITGTAVIIAEIIIAIVSLVFMIISVVKKQKCITYTMLVLIFIAIPCVFGTAVLMFLILGFTYGQGI